MVVLAFVILPLLSTVIMGTPVDVPYVFAATPVFASVAVPVMFDEPLKLGLV